MKEINLAIYDFDLTIYAGESSADFWLYTLLRRPYIVIFVPYQLIMSILFLLRIISLEKFKEAFMSYIRLFNKKNFDKYIRKFWSKKKHKIQPWIPTKLKEEKEQGWYLMCISASPSFLLAPIVKDLGIDTLISTNYKIVNGKQTNRMLSSNCKWKEKVIRLDQWATKNNYNYNIKRFYSDSLSDIPMFDIAEEKYFVQHGKILDHLPKQ